MIQPKSNHVYLLSIKDKGEISSIFIIELTYPKKKISSLVMYIHPLDLLKFQFLLKPWNSRKQGICLCVSTTLI